MAPRREQPQQQATGGAHRGHPAGFVDILGEGLVEAYRAARWRARSGPHMLASRPTPDNLPQPDPPSMARPRIQGVPQQGLTNYSFAARRCLFLPMEKDREENQLRLIMKMFFCWQVLNRQSGGLQTRKCLVWHQGWDKLADSGSGQRDWCG